MSWALKGLLLGLGAAILLGLEGPPTVFVPLPAAPDAATRAASAAASVSARGHDLTGYTIHQYLVEDEPSIRYLQGRVGAPALRARLPVDRLPVIYWYLRLVKEGETRRHGVRLGLDGTLLGHVDILPEGQEGERIPDELARERAGNLIEGEGWELREFHRVDLDHRRDHRLVYQKELPGLHPEVKLLRTVTLTGGRIGGVESAIRLPEPFRQALSRESEIADVLFYVAVTAQALLLIGAVATLVRRRRRDLGYRSEGWLAGLVLLTLTVTAINYMPVSFARSYTPEKPPWAFWLSSLLSLCVLGMVPALAAFLTLAAGRTLEDENAPSPSATLRKLVGGQILDPDVGRSLARGMLLSLALGGGELLFYGILQGAGAVSIPVGALWVNSMATTLPVLYPLSISLGAAITEEAAFRYFAISALARTRLASLALVLPAAAWAFAHSREPVYPVGTRGLELFLGGLVLGAVFRRTDLLTVMTAHYLYDAVTFGWPLLRSPDPAVSLPALAVVLAPVLPGLVGLARLLKRGLSRRFLSVARTGCDPPRLRTGSRPPPGS